MKSALFVLLTCIAVLLLAIGCSKDGGGDTTGPVGENHPPVMQEIRDTTAVLGDTLWIPIKVSDPDGDELHFQLLIECTWDRIFTDKCPRAGIRTSAMSVWFWPRIYDLGWSWFMAVVDDGRGASDSTRFGIALMPRVGCQGRQDAIPASAVECADGGQRSDGELAKEAVCACP